MKSAPSILRVAGGTPSLRHDLVALLKANGYAVEEAPEAIRVSPGDFPFGRDTVCGDRYELKRPRKGSVDITVRELALLRFFASRPDEALSRDALLDAVWGVSYYGTTRTLDQHISKLRQKLSDPTVIETVHRVGYRYRSGY